ncbi:MAG TPA: glutamate--tRNA ligase [Kiritimatiellia bacterium]|nr:glutamate--tRNA ligase [Kiritimatiellia bacterium]
MKIRTRFAPSPTGHVHIGNIRAAIYGWLFARHEGGNFLLRIEDTDRERSTPEAVRMVLDAMNWLGLTFDEEPLYQSTRTPAHLAAAEQLLSKGLAYKEDKGGTGMGEAIIFRMPGTDMEFRDEVKGVLRKKAEDMKDFVIVRSNGTPVFHLANIVDDIHMGITHVIRGDDHVENTYRHLALFRALGAEPPKYAHLPMIVNAQGKPYSKRDGAAYVGEFRDKGYLPGALFNYLALLGWSPGDDREIMSREELVKAFTLDRVRSAPSQMDIKKLDWMNGAYMRALPKSELEQGCCSILEQKGLWPVTGGMEYLARVVETMGERLHFFADIADHAAYFFTEDYAFDEKAVSKRLKKEGALESLRTLAGRFAALEPFTAATSEQALRAMAEQRGEGAGALVHPVRVAVSGTSEGPSLFHMLEVLGKDRVLSRIRRALDRFASA